MLSALPQHEANKPPLFFLGLLAAGVAPGAVDVDVAGAVAAAAAAGGYPVSFAGASGAAAATGAELSGTL